MPTHCAGEALSRSGGQGANLVDRISVEQRLEAIMEELAAIEHERWAHWQRYMHSKAERLDDGSLRIPVDLVARWESQIARPYAQLEDEEKESDREQVRRYLARIAAALQG